MFRRSSRDKRGRVKDYSFKKELKKESRREHQKARDEGSRRSDSPRRERSSNGIFKKIFGDW